MPHMRITIQILLECLRHEQNSVTLPVLFKRYLRQYTTPKGQEPDVYKRSCKEGLQSKLQVCFEASLVAEINVYDPKNDPDTVSRSSFVPWVVFF